MSAKKISEPETYDWQKIVSDFIRLLRLRTTPIGMKWYATETEMMEIPKLRRPKDIFTADQIVGQAARLNWTVGVTAKDLVGTQCAAVLGLGAQDAEWFKGASYSGVWYGSDEDAAAHQESLDVVPDGAFEGMAVSPLVTGRIDPPDICLIYATPAQMILFINGLQWVGYKKLEWGCVGETACADSWGRARKTGEPSLSIPCFAERRYGGVMDDELLMALPPHFLPKVFDGLEHLSRNGLRYPIPPYGLQNDVRAGMGFSYPGRE
jgi:uncharacterized protein (DUF169 family)